MILETVCIIALVITVNAAKTVVKLMKTLMQNSIEAIKIEDFENYDIMEHQIKYRTDGSNLESQEEARNGSNLSIIVLRKNMLLDINILLNRVACKSERLRGNNTTNLTESWMHIRSKFDEGKFITFVTEEAGILDALLVQCVSILVQNGPQ